MRFGLNIYTSIYPDLTTISMQPPPGRETRNNVTNTLENPGKVDNYILRVLQLLFVYETLSEMRPDLQRRQFKLLPDGRGSISRNWQ